MWGIQGKCVNTLGVGYKYSRYEGPIAPLLLVWFLYRDDIQLIAQEAHKCASGCNHVKGQPIAPTIQKKPAERN